MTDTDTLLSHALALVNEDHRGQLADIIESIITAAQQSALEAVCRLECKWCNVGRPAEPAVDGEWIHHSLTANLDEWEWCKAAHIRNLMTEQKVTPDAPQA